MRNFWRNLKRLIPGRTYTIDLCWMFGSIGTITVGGYLGIPWVVLMGLVGIIAMVVKILVDESL